MCRVDRNKINNLILLIFKIIPPDPVSLYHDGSGNTASCGPTLIMFIDKDNINASTVNQQ